MGYRHWLLTGYTEEGSLPGLWNLCTGGDSFREVGGGGRERQDHPQETGIIEKSLCLIERENGGEKRKEKRSENSKRTWECRHWNLDKYRRIYVDENKRNGDVYSLHFQSIDSLHCQRYKHRHIHRHSHAQKLHEPRIKHWYRYRHWHISTSFTEQIIAA